MGCKVVAVAVVAVVAVAVAVVAVAVVADCSKVFQRLVTWPLPL